MKTNRIFFSIGLFCLFLTGCMDNWDSGSNNTISGTTPANMAESVSFTDIDLQKGEVGGVVSIEKASDESDITHYVLYWGTGDSEKLSETSIVSIPKTGSDFTHEVSSDTILPEGATHFLVYSQNEDGEGDTPVAASITDTMGVKLLLIRLEFRDQTFNSDASVWAQKIFGTNPGQMNHYFNEVSHGNNFQFLPAEEISGDVNDGVVTVKLNVNHPNPDGTGDGEFHQELVEAIEHADQYVDFMAFDTNGDNSMDSNELQIMYIWAGYEAAISESEPKIWAHYLCVSSITEGIRAPILDEVTVLDCDYDENYVYHGKGNGYTLFGEIQGNHNATIGVIAHELGHSVFGLPDLYDTDPDNGKSSGIGRFGLMGGGLWNAVSDEYLGATPAHPCAWSKVQLNFAAASTVSSEGTFSLKSTDWTDYNILKLETGIEGEYFLLENRGTNGYDRGLYALDGETFTGGLAIWHIDDNQSGNMDETRKLVDLEEANDPVLDDDSDDKGNRTNLFYHPNATGFADDTIPDSKRYDGTSTGVSVTNISAAGDEMSGYIVP